MIDDLGFCVDFGPHGLIVIQEDGRRTLGIPPAMVEKDAYCEDCGQSHDLEACPKCGGWIELSYGLMGGGCGMVKFCTACGWLYKEFDREDDE